MFILFSQQVAVQRKQVSLPRSAQRSAVANLTGFFLQSDSLLQNFELLWTIQNLT
jgi:hypothetical protein